MVLLLEDYKFDHTIVAHKCFATRCRDLTFCNNYLVWEKLSLDLMNSICIVRQFTLCREGKERFSFTEDAE